ncbi:cyd operon protein YbgE [Vibrio zhanjiangensis]|uniref:Cyd operon protein YbgE n=1 Tax=Vibrio zhanjiangensis TaxID=1046128 RepID=A0ABQ6EX17_9VIBR|nr:cyd operon protein YbgE [Vibrio zhanjiangensis]GLT17713.1 cyd operon protein YbgE [Vibrio zhanjiangensis]
MISIAGPVTRLHAPMDKVLLRALSLILGFYHVALVMWDPKLYAEQIGGFNIVITPLMIWAMCSSMVFGLAFKPQNWYWQVLFSPYFSISILIYLTAVRMF